MSEFTNPAAFAKAQKIYGDVQLLLNAAVDEYMKNHPHASFDRGIFLRQYDYALQCALLAVAIADGTINRDEVLAIRDLAQNGNLLALISDDDDPIDWEDFVDSSAYVSAKFQLRIEKSLEETVDNFMTLIAITAEENEEADFIKLFFDKTHSIAGAIALVDGATNDNEGFVAAAKMDEIFIASLKRVLRNLH